MRQSMLIIAVVCLGFYSTNTLAQAPGTNNASQTHTKGCPALVAQTLPADRVANARKCYKQGLELSENGQLVQASEIFRQAVQFDPEYADAYAALGRTYFKLREWQKAIANLNRAASLKGKQRETNESALKNDPIAQNKPIPKASPADVQNNSSGANSTTKQTSAMESGSIQPKQQSQAVNVQSRPVQSSSPTVQPPPAPVANRNPINNLNPPPAPLKQYTAAIIEINKFPAPPPPKETQNTATLTKTNSVQSSSQLNVSKETEAKSIDGPTQPSGQRRNRSIQPATSSEAPKFKAVEAEVKTVVGPIPPASKNPARPEQTPIGASVAMSVPPALNLKVKETVSPAVSTIPRTEELPLTKIYRVGPNDVLDVRLNDSGQQSTLYTVTATGLLEHPLLTEPMSVAGLTVEEIGTRLNEDLRKRAIIENPKAVVGVRDYASHAVLVSGLVKDAGTKFLRREAIPLYVVVADAQPLPEAAKVSVVRNESNQLYEIDLNQAADMNFLVRPGDVITLSPNTTQFVYIGGEVKFPGEKTFRRGLTLMQVILSAGGADQRAKIAEISRDDGNGFLVPTRFNLKEIVSGKAMDPTLKPGDRISILR